jgi:hypothetical protein
MDTDRGGADVSNPDEFVSSGFNAIDGVARITVRQSQRAKTAGRIDVNQDSLIYSNRYAYWLDGKHHPEGEFLFRYLVEHPNSYTLEAPVDQDKVRLTVPWQPLFRKTPLGTRQFVLDPRKGFLPVRGKARWDEPGSPPSWRTEEFVVEASQLVGDVWMPTKLKEMISSSNGDNNTVAVWIMDVTKIESGNVTAKDLKVSFSKGMEIVDAIKGIAFVVGENGQPTRVERLVGARPQTALPPAVSQKPAGTMWRNLLILASVVMGIALAMITVQRIVAKRRAKLLEGEIQPSPKA